MLSLSVLSFTIALNTAINGWDSTVNVLSDPSKWVLFGLVFLAEFFILWRTIWLIMKDIDHRD